MRITSTPLAAALVAAYANAIMPPYKDCDIAEDNYLFDYPARLKWAFASLHDGFEFSPYVDGDSYLHDEDIPDVVHGLRENANFNGISLPMSPETLYHSEGGQSYTYEYDFAYCFARYEARMMIHTSPVDGIDPRTFFTRPGLIINGEKYPGEIDDEAFLDWIYDYINVYTPEFISPFTNVDVTQDQHLVLLEGLLERLHGPRKTPTRWMEFCCEEFFFRRERDLAVAIDFDVFFQEANEFGIILLWLFDVDDDSSVFSIFTDDGSGEPDDSKWKPANQFGRSEDGTTSYGETHFTANRKSNWSDNCDPKSEGSGIWSWMMQWPAELYEFGPDVGDKWCFKIVHTSGEDETSVTDCVTIRPKGEPLQNALHTVPIGPSFSFENWPSEEKKYEFDNVHHSGFKGTYEYLNQKHEFKDIEDWHYVPLAQAYSEWGFIGADTVGDNHAKYKDWSKLLEFGVEDITIDSPNWVFNSQTPAEWYIKHSGNNYDYDDLDAEYVWEERRGRSRQLRSSRKLHGSHSKSKSNRSLGYSSKKCRSMTDTPAEYIDCLKMPSITEAIDGGVCGIIAWRAYPRFVTHEGRITNRAHSWLEGGFANDAYTGKERKHCNGNESPHSKSKKGHGSKPKKSKSPKWKGYCPVDPDTGFFELKVRDGGRPEPECGEGKDIILSAYSPCATTLDEKAYQVEYDELEGLDDVGRRLGGARRLEDAPEFEGVSITPNFPSTVKASYEECSQVTGECVLNDIVSGDSYVVHFDDTMAYNFIATNQVSEPAFIEMNYEFIEASIASGAYTLSATLVGTAAIIATLF